MSSKIKHSLSSRFSWAIIGVVSLILLFFSAVVIFYNLSREEKLLNQELEQARQYARTSLPSVIWQYDTNAMMDILDAMFLKESIVYLSIRDKNETLAEKLRPEFKTVDFSYFRGSSEFICDTIDIKKGHNTIAQFRIAISKSQSHAQLLINIISVIALLLAIIAAVLLISMFVTRRYIFNPLLKLRNSAESIAEGNWDTAIDTGGEDEIAVLAGTFDRMRFAVKQLFLDLEEYGKTLENKVQARTFELKEKNKKLDQEREKLLNEILERKRMEKELIVAKDKAFAATSAKSEFLANMSHEIRTPMNAILGFTEILKSNINDDELLRHLEAIESSGRLLLCLINDMLDLSKIEAGKMALQFDPVNPTFIFDEIRHIFSERIREKGLQFIMEIDRNLPEYLVMDEIRLRQVIFNLVGNAVKFTSSGYIKLVLKKADTPSREGRLSLSFSVEDTGMGIPPNQIDSIFEAFKQKEGQDSRKYGGTGLGLTITKRLVSMMGGKIRIESQVGKGSTFTVMLRDVVVASGSTPRKSLEEDMPEGVVEFEEATLLIVDDIDYNLTLMRNFLDFPSLRFIEACNGQEAVDFARHYHPELILMDLKMPVMTGYEAIEILKGEEELKDIPVIFVTADAMKRKEDDRWKNKCDGFLKKPVSKKQLITEVMRHLPHTVKPHPEAEKKRQEPEKEVVTPPLDAEVLKGIPKLLDILETEITPLWKTVNHEFIFSEIESFAHKIIKLGLGYQLPLLSDWGKKILREAGNFDMEKLPDTLLYFPRMKEDIAALR